MTHALPHRARLVAIALIAAFAGLASAEAPRGTSVEERFAGAASPEQPVLVVHYHRPDRSFDRWNLWTWADGEQGAGVPFSARTTFGRYAVIRPAADESRRGVILRRGDWEDRDVEGDRWIALDDDGFTEVWLVSGEPTIYTDPAQIDLSPRLIAAFLDDSDSIFTTIAGAIDPRTLGRAAVLLDGAPGVYTIDRVASTDSRGSSRGVVYEIVLDRPIGFEHVSKLSLDIPGVGAATVFARDVLTEPRFTALDAELGAIHDDNSTTFRVWSPVSESVDLLLFDTAERRGPASVVPMTHKGRGVWEATRRGDLHGQLYAYRYESYGERRVAPDIHAFATHPTADRSIVVDFDRVEPAGWGTIAPPQLARPTDEVIYEIHVRDFTIDDPSLHEDRRGTYLGLLHEGDVSSGGHATATGLSHLLELGVTAVHLLPIHDYPGPPDEYNWGYWTSFFNTPEANYATDPSDSLLAITELKRAIAGLHERGIRVILDVVYNHTSSSFEWSPFFRSVPYYYFRTTVDGRLRNDAGVGNSIADERPMVRKFIGDSLEFWTRQYRIDGYRFDLIGTHRPASVAEWVQRVRRVRPDLTIYGEPWTGGGPLYFPKGAQRGVGLAVFNDHFRNAIRGDLDGAAQGYATGPWGDISAVRNGIAGAIDDFTDDPTETINYVSAHDNLTFWDKLVLSNPDATDRERRAMQKFAHAVMLTAQGIAFIHGGADFARTKRGNHNSYNAGDDINRFDWQRKRTYADVVAYVAGLVELRRAQPAFRMTERDDIRRRVEFLDQRASDDRVVVFTLESPREPGAWPRILVAHNGSPERQTLSLPAGRWTQVVDHERAGTEPIAQRSGAVELEPFSSSVFHR